MLAKLLFRLPLVIAFALLLLPIGCKHYARRSNQEAMKNDAKSWDPYVNDFLEAYFTARPDFAVRAGRHEFDGKLPDWSAEGIANEIKRLRAEKDHVSRFKNTLDEGQRLERDYLLSVINADLFWLESAEWPYRNPYFYADAIDPDVYVSRDYAPLDQRLRAYTAYARAIPNTLEQIRKNLRTPLPKTFVNIGHTNFGGLVSFYQKDVPGIFASVKDEQLQKDFKDANDGAVKAMQDIDAWFKTQEATATTNFQLGADKFSEMLKATEDVDVPLDKLAAV